jgi:hypothetical protein
LEGFCGTYGDFFLERKTCAAVAAKPGFLGIVKLAFPAYDCHNFPLGLFFKRISAKKSEVNEVKKRVCK